MQRKQLASMLTMASVAGLLGGVVSSNLFRASSAFAQTSQESFFAKTVITNRLLIQDSKGQPRAVFGAFAGESVVSLILLDEDKTPRCVLTLYKAPALAFFDKSGKERLMLKALDDGGHIWFNDESGEQRLALHLINGDPALRLFDSSGSGLQLVDKNGAARASFGVGEDGDARLRIFGKDFNETIWSAPN